MKRIIALLMALTMALSLCACDFASEEVFTCGDLSITLTSAFEESSADGQDAYFESQKVGVTVLKEEKSDLVNSDTMTKKDYAELVVKTYEKTTIGGVSEIGGLTYFTYVATVDGTGYTYEAYIYETSDAFWMVQFFCHTDNYDKYADSFKTWAQSVTIKDSAPADKDTAGESVETTTKPADTNKTFTCGDVTLTLTKDFEETTVEGQDAAYLSNNMGVTVLSQTRDELTALGYNGSEMTAKEYAQLIIDSNEQTVDEIKEENGLTYYTYNASSTNYNFTYQAYLFATADEIYMVQFYCISSDYETCAPMFAQWASQIVVA